MRDMLRRHWSRRELFRRSGLLALPAIFGGQTAAASSARLKGSRSFVRGEGSRSFASGALSTTDVYQSIGVRPLINARGTFTIISGSLMLPEVRAAMDAASQHHVHLDELMEAIGARLADL